MSKADSIDGEWEAASGEPPRPSAASEPWSVNADGSTIVDMTAEEIAAALRSRTLTQNAWVWREGMPDWVRLTSVPALRAALHGEESPRDSGMRTRVEESSARPIEELHGAPSATRSTPDSVTTPSRPVPPALLEPVLQDETAETETSDGSGDLGFLAVYERPFATLEFEDALDDAETTEPPTVEPPTVAPPKVAPPKLKPPRPSRPSESPPALRATEVRAAPPAAKPSAATAPATTLAATTTEPQPATNAVTATEPVPATNVATSAEPEPATNATPQSEAATPQSEAATPQSAVDAESASAHDSSRPVIGPPRPALATLPPIIVRELPDDGTELLAMPAKARFDEATLVLAGRRRNRRWVPMNAAIVATFGAALLASALTWIIVRPARRAAATEATTSVTLPRAATSDVRTRPAPAQRAGTEAPVPAAPAVIGTASETAPQTEAQGAVAARAAGATANRERAAGTKGPDVSPAGSSAMAGTVRAPAEASEPSRSAAPATPVAREDGARADPNPDTLAESEPPSALPASKPVAQPTPSAARAGWPSNPGF